jgi:hypothetical protein
VDEHLNIYSCSILNLDFFSKHVSLALNLNFTWSYSCALFVLLQFLLKLFEPIWPFLLFIKHTYKHALLSTFQWKYQITHPLSDRLVPTSY